MKRPRSSSARLDQLGNDDNVVPSAAPSYPRQLFKHRSYIAASLDDLEKTDSFYNEDVLKCKSLDTAIKNENSFTQSPSGSGKILPSIKFSTEVSNQFIKTEDHKCNELESSNEIEKIVEGITQKFLLELAAKDSQIKALQNQYDEKSKNYSSDILLATKKETDLIHLIKAKDTQIHDLQRQLLSKSSELVKEKKTTEEALAEGKEYRHICRRLEHKLEKLQKKYSDAVGKEKAMRASVDSYATQRDGECAIFIGATRSKDLFEEDTTKSLKSLETNNRSRETKDRDQLFNNKRVSPEKANEISAMRMLMKFSDENRMIPMSMGNEPSAEAISNKQLLIRRLCDEHNVQSTDIFDGELMTKKFCSDFMFKKKWFWVDPTTCSIHWVKTASEKGNRAMSKYLLSKKSNVPTEVQHRLGHQKGIISSVGKFPGASGGIFITTDNNEYLELKGSARCLDNWMKVLKVIV